MDTATMDDSDDTIPLLRQAAAGDQHALGALWDRYRERLKRMVRLRLDRRLQGRLDPSDILQESFIDFARRAGICSSCRGTWATPGGSPGQELHAAVSDP